VQCHPPWVHSGTATPTSEPLDASGTAIQPGCRAEIQRPSLTPIFPRPRLINAGPSQADISGADLGQADREGADLAGATLDGTPLCDTTMPNGG
jgi:hypothetical protein